MDGVDRAARRPSLKERLGLNLKGLGCCGATWGLGPTTLSVRDAIISAAQDPAENGPAPPCAAQSHSPATTGMNLAAALAAERQLRAALDSDSGGGASLGPQSPGTPARVSLMRLLEETDGYDGVMMKKEEDGDQGCASVCCVCMGRKKGAAFIPCGHTFCRVCSRELWLNRGSCPLCNRPIIEILDIY
ncbi:probable E3 ubiquitin-protein ligase lul4 [Phtheirospermum japonicum]|uniref:Probable E3 ubiquitin-protein ligase lul4 n=1 Tax=Phtheirospermum japonicum TaxID=374723 RepID=A0A830CI41_9LAMI|nr:probable E3 ubiquitin-protein ligase lul4 [Phtheirospermum japonicum]